MIRPDPDERIDPTMLEVFFRGLMSMAVEQDQTGTATATSTTGSTRRK
jgi:hypothetical protein